MPDDAPDQPAQYLSGEQTTSYEDVPALRDYTSRGTATFSRASRPEQAVAELIRMTYARLGRSPDGSPLRACEFSFRYGGRGLEVSFVIVIRGEPLEGEPP